MFFSGEKHDLHAALWWECDDRVN